MQCPACNRKKGIKNISNKGYVFQCPKCEAIFSDNIYLGDSYNFVLPYFAKNTVDPDVLRYYDFTCLGSQGIIRRHGWYDPNTKLVHQVG